MKPLKPRKLVPGDLIGIAAPASWGSRKEGEKAASVLEGLGFRIRLGDAYARQYGYLAGTDEERATELNALFADPEVKAIVCARGGYGTGRIADLLDYAMIRANPKAFWGYSDITFLHLAIGQRTGLVTFHGPMLIDLGNEEPHPLDIANFKGLLEPALFRYEETFSPLQAWTPGIAEGAVTGGNLSLLVSTLGTPYEWDTNGKLVLLEDIGEEPYRVDRMLNQLKHAGKFDQAAGFLIGDFKDCIPAKRKESLTLEQVFIDHLLPSGKPCLSGFRIGHCSPHIAIPFGVPMRMDTAAKRVEGLEAAVQS